MLSEILASLSEGKTLSQYELAERLNTTPEIIADRVDFLQRVGYLRKACLVKNCGKKCARCPIGDVTPEDSLAVLEAVR
jgi:DNA-binding Lrp family transcriptional regulator